MKDHIKDVGIVLSGNDRERIERFIQLGHTKELYSSRLAALRWLHDPELYKAVPRRSLLYSEGAKLLDRQVDLMVQRGHAVEIDPAVVDYKSTEVNCFVVPEVSKNRVRIIKWTVGNNDTNGRETLQASTQIDKRGIVKFPSLGSWMIAFDFAAWFDQFEYSDEISSLLCFRHLYTDGRDIAPEPPAVLGPPGASAPPPRARFFRLSRLAMGQRQAVEVATTATDILLDFPMKCSSEKVIDNVIFLGSKEDVISAAKTFVERCRAAGATLNDQQEIDELGVERLATQVDDWCGVRLDLKEKTVAQTVKSVEKLRVSWMRRDAWTWRHFAGHIGLLFWSWGINDLPMADFFPTLSFLSKASQLLAENEDLWDAPARIWPSVWPNLERWTQISTANVPRRVHDFSGAPDWYVVTDASAYGWGYIALNERSGEYRAHGEGWNQLTRRLYGEALRHSTFAEPLAIKMSLNHLLPRCPSAPVRVKLGTDSVTAMAVFNHGWASRSYAINEVVRAVQEEFGSMFKFEAHHVPGVANIADGRSRGLVETAKAGEVSGAEIESFAAIRKQYMGAGN